MKLFLFYISILAFAFSIKVQTIPFNYSLKLKPVTVSGLPGLHSFAFAQSGNKWLIIGGRKDGLHARQPFNAFLEVNSNSDIYVIDVINNQYWTASVNTLASGLKEQLQSTNMNFFQDKDSLYIIGGYGYSATALDHVTYPNLTSISVTGLINAIVNGTPIVSNFKQITDTRFAVNGGHLGKIGTTFYLIGGHKFDGRYNPMGMATYTQTYVDGLSKFTINNYGTALSVSNYTKTTDMVHLHRRDYNLMPQIFPTGEEGYTISSGVFQIGVDLPFLYPVDIKASGHNPVTGFNQYLSNYHSANISTFDRSVPIDYKHEMIVTNLWTNALETEDNRDEDGNGYQDDVHGWNFAEQNGKIIDYKYLGTFSEDCKTYFDIQGKYFLNIATEAENAWLKAKVKEPAFLKEMGKFGNFVHGTHVAGITVRESKNEAMGIKLIPTETKLFFEALAKNKVAASADRWKVLETAFTALATQQMKLLTDIAKFAAFHKADIANGSFGTGFKQAKMISDNAYRIIFFK